MLQVLAAPSAAFHPIEPIAARQEEKSPWRDIGKIKSSSQVQRIGLRYENRVRKALLASPEWQHGKWFSYSKRRIIQPGPARSWCQVDAFRVDASRLVILEIKLRWCAEAIRQLCALYRPVLEQVYPGRSVDLWCVCGSFDPAVPGSNLAYFCGGLDEPPPPERIGVIIWKGKRR